MLIPYSTEDAPICHSREGGNPGFSRTAWIPAFAGMTGTGTKRFLGQPPGFALAPLEQESRDEGEKLQLAISVQTVIS